MFFIGSERADVIEDGDTRTIKKTGVYSSLELKLFFYQPHFDERLVIDSDDVLIDFGQRWPPIDSQEKWERFLSHLPFTMTKQHKSIVSFIHSKCKSKEIELHKEAMHALWELVVDKKFHSQIEEKTMECVTQCLSSEDPDVSFPFEK